MAKLYKLFMNTILLSSFHVCAMDSNLKIEQNIKNSPPTLGSQEKSTKGLSLEKNEKKMIGTVVGKIDVNRSIKSLKGSFEQRVVSLKKALESWNAKKDKQPEDDKALNVFLKFLNVTPDLKKLKLKELMDAITAARATYNIKEDPRDIEKLFDVISKEAKVDLMYPLEFYKKHRQLIESRYGDEDREDTQNQTDDVEQKLSQTPYTQSQALLIAALGGEKAKDMDLKQLLFEFFTKEEISIKYKGRESKKSKNVSLFGSSLKSAEDKRLLPFVKILKREEENKDRVFLYHAATQYIAALYDIYSKFRAKAHINNGDAVSSLFRGTDTNFKNVHNIHEFIENQMKVQGVGKESLSNYSGGFEKTGISFNLFLTGCFDRAGDYSPHYFLHNYSERPVDFDTIVKSFLKDLGIEVDEEMDLLIKEFKNHIPNVGRMFQFALTPAVAEKYAYSSFSGGPVLVFKEIENKHDYYGIVGPILYIRKNVTEFDSNIFSRVPLENMQARLFASPELFNNPGCAVYTYWPGNLSEKDIQNYNVKLDNFVNEIMKRFLLKKQHVGKSAINRKEKMLPSQRLAGMVLEGETGVKTSLEKNVRTSKLFQQIRSGNLDGALRSLESIKGADLNTADFVIDNLSYYTPLGYLLSIVDDRKKTEEEKQEPREDKKKIKELILNMMEKEGINFNSLSSIITDAFNKSEAIRTPLSICLHNKNCSGEIIFNLLEKKAKMHPVFFQGESENIAQLLVEAVESMRYDVLDVLLKKYANSISMDNLIFDENQYLKTITSQLISLYASNQDHMDSNMANLIEFMANQDSHFLNAYNKSYQTTFLIRALEKRDESLIKLLMSKKATITPKAWSIAFEEFSEKYEEMIQNTSFEQFQKDSRSPLLLIENDLDHDEEREKVLIDTLSSLKEKFKNEGINNKLFKDGGRWVAWALKNSFHDLASAVVNESEALNLPFDVEMWESYRDFLSNLENKEIILNTPSAKDSILRMAVCNGESLETINSLLGDEIDWNKENEAGLTPLAQSLILFKGSEWPYVEVLKENNALETSKNNTYLIGALNSEFENKQEIIGYLANNEFDGNRILEELIRGRYEEGIKYSIDNANDLGIDMNKGNNHGQTPLMTALSMDYDFEIIEKMIDAGADLTVKDKDNIPAFLFSISSSNFDNIKDKIHERIDCTENHTMSFLKKNLTKNNVAKLNEKCLKELNEDIVNEAYKNFEINEIESAFKDGMIANVTVLAKMQDFNRQDGIGDTFLMKIVKYPQGLAFLHYLIEEKKANPNLRNNSDQTALDIARKARDEKKDKLDMYENQAMNEMVEYLEKVTK